MAADLRVQQLSVLPGSYRQQCHITSSAALHISDPVPTVCLVHACRRLYLQTKLANPHYRPEIAAQTTMGNFGVTEAGLEEQLLALVVAHERPDLQEQAANLVRQLASFTITLTELEDDLLQRLASSQVHTLALHGCDWTWDPDRGLAMTAICWRW